MAEMGVCYLLRQLAVMVTAFGLAIPTQQPIPKIEVNQIKETGETELEVELNVENLIQYEVHEIPAYPGKKSYMPHDIFKKGSAQYQLQQAAITDVNGLQVVDGRYCVAVGTRFKASIGQYIDLVLSNGIVIPCVVGDIKSAKDTDSTNTFSSNGCCSEFVVNMTKLNKTAKTRGDVSYLNVLWSSPVKQIIVYQNWRDVEI